MLRIKNEQEGDGRWIAEIPALPGVLVYGSTNSDANAKAKVLALRVIADRLEMASHCLAESLMFLKRHGPPPRHSASLWPLFAPGLDNQTTDRFRSRARACRLARLLFAFHDREEIGPRALSRIGKHTGLTADDL